LIVTRRAQFWLPDTNGLILHRISHTSEGPGIIVYITSWNYTTFTDSFFLTLWTKDLLRWCFLNLCLLNTFCCLICWWEICCISSISIDSLYNNLWLILIVYYPFLNFNLNLFSSTSWFKCSTVNKWMRQILISFDCCLDSSVSDWSGRNPITLCSI